MNSIFSCLPEGAFWRPMTPLDTVLEQRTKLGRSPTTSHRMSSMISIDAHPDRSPPDQAKLKISSRIPNSGRRATIRRSRTTDGNLVLIGQLTSLNERRDGTVRSHGPKCYPLWSLQKVCAKCCRADSAIEIIWGIGVAH
jgi:hypothetical protein